MTILHQHEYTNSGLPDVRGKGNRTRNKSLFIWRQIPCQLWFGTGVQPRPIVNPLVPSGILGPGGGFEGSIGWADEVVPWPGEKDDINLELEKEEKGKELIQSDQHTKPIEATILLPARLPSTSTPVPSFLLRQLVSSILQCRNKYRYSVISILFRKLFNSMETPLISKSNIYSKENSIPITSSSGVPLWCSLALWVSSIPASDVRILLLFSESKPLRDCLRCALCPYLLWCI